MPVYIIVDHTNLTIEHSKNLTTVDVKWPSYKFLITFLILVITIVYYPPQSVSWGNMPLNIPPVQTPIVLRTFKLFCKWDAKFNQTYIMCIVLKFPRCRNEQDFKNETKCCWTEKLFVVYRTGLRGGRRCFMGVFGLQK